MRTSTPVPLQYTSNLLTVGLWVDQRSEKLASENAEGILRMCCVH